MGGMSLEKAGPAGGADVAMICIEHSASLVFQRSA